MNSIFVYSFVIIHLFVCFVMVQIIHFQFNGTQQFMMSLLSSLKTAPDYGKTETYWSQILKVFYSF